MTDRALFLDTAACIGRRIAAQAVWAGDACTWMVNVRHRSAPPSRAPELHPAGPGVYGGTAGIALFLLELDRLAPDPFVRRAAEGAVAHALKEPLPARTRLGFYEGQVGTAYAVARAGIVLGREDLLDAAGRTLDALSADAFDDTALDVISGAAGAIPVLLQLAALVDRGRLLETAAAVGERVMERAHVEPGGWAWGEAMQPLHARHLCGLAHGAAGMGHALLELWHASGDARFRYGAEQAFAYERQFFDAGEGNWLDLRHTAALTRVQTAPPEELRVRWLAGDPALVYEPRFVSGWCHGAPGIALTRLRAHALTRRAIYREEAEAALGNTLRWVTSGLETMNHSLCHGLSGNGAILLHAGRVLDRAEFRQAAERIGVAGAARFERGGEPWPCGGPDGVTAPGLMLGEAGIGWFHLMLAADDVPNLLLPTAPPPRAPALPGWDQAARERRMADAEAYFARTLRVLRDGGEPPDRILPPLDPERGAVVQAFESLRHRVMAEHHPATAARLRDAFRLDARRYRMIVEIADFLHDYLRERLRPEPAPVDWDAAKFRIADHVALIETARDWDADDPEAAGPVLYLLHRARNQVSVRRLSRLAALVLREVERQPAGWDAVTARVAEAAAVEPDAALQERVRCQLESLYRGGVVEWSPARARG